MKRQKLDTDNGLILPNSTKKDNEIVFSANYGNRDLRLFECPKEVIEDFKQNGVMRIVGEQQGDAVLCSSSRTYAIKKVETSNSVYLVPPSQSENFVIESKHFFFYELTLLLPPIDVIEEKLRSTAYAGKVVEMESPPDSSKLQTLSDLKETIQASDAEIESALQKIGVTEINGFIRAIDRNYKYEALEDIINTIIEKNMDISNITLSSCANLVEDYEPVILEYMMRGLLGGSVRGQLESNRNNNCVLDGIWSLDFNIIAKTIANILFRKKKTELFQNNSSQVRWQFEDFMLTWRAHLPSCHSNPNTSISEDMLQGVAIIEQSDQKSHRHKFLLYLPLDELSRIPQVRFQQIFEVKSSYTLDQIQPYLYDIVGGHSQPKTVAEILLLYTRNIDGCYIPKL